MFSEALLDHFGSPRNVGEMEGADADSEVENPVCGDRLHLWLRLDGTRIRDVRWRAEGCAPAIAAASVMSDMVRGMNLEEARVLNREAVEEALGGLPPRKAHASQLAVAAIHAAIDRYDMEERPGGD